MFGPKFLRILLRAAAKLAMFSFTLDPGVAAKVCGRRKLPAFAQDRLDIMSSVITGHCDTHLADSLRLTVLSATLDASAHQDFRSAHPRPRLTVFAASQPDGLHPTPSLARLDIKIKSSSIANLAAVG